MIGSRFGSDGLLTKGMSPCLRVPVKTPLSTSSPPAHTGTVADDAPWIDPVVVPDDISSLQPDIDAYHRECQHARRQRLRRRLASSTTLRRWGPLAGTMLGALALAAVVFVVLTVGDMAVRTRPAPAPIATGVTAPVGAQGGLLPVATLRTQAGEPVDIRGQRPSLVALLPLHCECADLVATLAGQA